MLILVSNCGELFVKGEFRLSSNSKSRVPQNNTPSIASTNKQHLTKEAKRREIKPAKILSFCFQRKAIKVLPRGQAGLH